MTDDPLNLALKAYESGKMAAASALCAPLLAANPEHAAALLILGLVAEHEKKFEEAVALLRRSVRSDPGARALTTLANCLWHINKLDEGLVSINEALSRYPDFPEAHLVAAALLHGLRCFDDALKSARRARQLMPESERVEALLGSIQTQLSRFEDAEVHFRRAAERNPKFALCRLINFSESFWRKIEPQPAAAATDEIHSVYDARDGSDFKSIVATFCDARYVCKYGATFVNSFAQNAARMNLLHLHIIDPDREFTAFLDNLVARVRLPNFVVTIDYAPLDDEARVSLRKTYYSCARLLHMNHLLEHYRKTVLCFDIDTVFEQPVDLMVDYVSGKDIGLIRREPPSSPWLDIVANVIIARNTAPAKRFFEAVSNYVNYFMRRGELYWHLDQIALYCVLQMMERFAEPPQVGWITQSAQASIWHIGHAYDFKLEEQRFSRYQLEP